VQALKRCGANLHIADDGRVLGVAMPAKATDAHLAALRGLTDVQRLYAPSPKVTDEGLKSVEHLKQLRTLNLNETGITDAGMTRIARLSRLRSLYLDRTGIADEGLAHLSRLKELSVLSLRGTRITDSGLQHVRKMKRIVVLNVPDTGVTADGILHLRLDLPQLDVSSTCGGESTHAREKLKQLALLESEDGCVTSVRIETQQGVDEGLRLLSGLSGLKRLSLIGVTLTPEHITTLTELEDIERLEVAVHERIAHKDYGRLRQAMHPATIAGWYLGPPSRPPAGEDLGTRTVSLCVSSSRVAVGYTRLPKELDGIVFPCSYFPGDLGTESAPVVLLHDWGGSREDLGPLARKLQSRGHAVVVPEVWAREDDGLLDPSADDEPPLRSRLSVAPLWDIWCAQMDAIMSFLFDEHNKGNLNTSLLCLVTDGKTCFLATNWIMLWARDPPAHPVLKVKAFDIKAMVCLSPRLLGGHTEVYILRPPASISDIPMMLLVGAQSKDSHDSALKFYTSLNRDYDSSRPRHRSRKELKHPNLSLRTVVSGKQGVALIRDHPASTEAIVDFVGRSIEDSREKSPWKVRVTSTLESAFESE